MTAETFSQFSPHLSVCTSSILANPRACALFLDVDGTLLDLADTPKGVRVPDGLIATLQRLSLAFDGAVAIITGRLISEIDLLLSPLRLAASGVHGAELRKGPDRDIERITATLPSDLIQSMRRLALDIPGVIAEPKGAGIAVHYRLAPQAERLVLEALEAALDKHAGAFELLPGKRLFEVVPSGLSKGTALASLTSLPAFRGRVPIMIGDDIGDEPAFAAAEGMHGFALRVAGEQYPMEAADFAGPRSVINWLDQLTRRMTPTERPQVQP
ncbi:trehalose-phosphatase [Hyphomicrobium sp. CS1GBMeth3]|uniref:trehalose-phosphatase n=1 Tax=Hyphomicrobium sp. CS1GBMeth3 TaxID=1892845 RepID=UPI00093138E5|nr:trehalose-phosphatase [Hyphomicrobium sp. CS1GBMeth3]